MRVAYVTPSISRQAGGLKDSVRLEALALNSCGVDVSIHSLEDSDSPSEVGDWRSLQVTLAHGRGPARFSYSSGWLPRLLKAAPDLVSTHGLWRYTSLVSLQWQAQTGKPYVVSPHGMLDPWALRNARGRKRIAALLFEDRHLKQAGCLRALSASEEKAIRDYGLRNPVAVIPNGVDLPDLGLASPPPWSGIEGFANVKVLLSIGRLHPKKNLAALLRAWQQVTTSRSKGSEEWRVVIAGWDEGGYEEELKECAKTLGLSEQVCFSGPLFGAQKEAAYRSASAFVLPSLSEGLPMVVLEAWSYGLPVVMTPECNLPEGFEAGAALPISASAESMAEAVRKLVALNDSERAVMGQNGRMLCERRFNRPHIAMQMKDLFHWLLGEKARPAFVSE